MSDDTIPHSSGHRSLALQKTGGNDTGPLAFCSAQLPLMCLSGNLCNALQSISLGVHCVSDAFPEAMLLMEVLPALLASRDFPRLGTARMLEAGYRDSPHPSSVAIVFVMVSCPTCCAPF